MSLWTELSIEVLLKKRLRTKFGQHNGDEIYADYISARRELLENLLNEIKSNEPQLSDHGPTHIHDVLQKAYELAGDELKNIPAIELYILCISILFHDVGNFDGRQKHNLKIAKIYDLVRNKQHRFSTERSAVIAIAGAHTGFCKKGTKDTLKELANQGVFSNPVRSQQISALLRFADELAEGPQRTSTFMQEFKRYDSNSLPYHRLANVTTYTVDRENHRIQADYDITIEIDENNTITDGSIPLENLLQLINQRILKVNEERKYCRYYCDLLKPFREISITFRFIYEHEYLDLDLPPLILNDLIIPGEKADNICEPNHSADNIFSKINTALEKLA